MSTLQAPTYDELKARLTMLETKLAAKNKLTFKVSEKGAISVYGLQRFPVTLYWEQWERLLAVVDDLRRFAKAHETELTSKI